MSEEVRQAFINDQIVPTAAFYQQLPTSLLEKLQAGLTSDFDARWEGDVYRQPAEWLSARLLIIDQILEQRQTGQSKPMNRWTLIVHRLRP